MIGSRGVLLFVRETMGKRQNPNNQDSKLKHQSKCAFYCHILTSLFLEVTPILLGGGYQCSPDEGTDGALGD
jgi:hypothetical protein